MTDNIKMYLKQGAIEWIELICSKGPVMKCSEHAEIRVLKFYNH